MAQLSRGKWARTLSTLTLIAAGTIVEAHHALPAAGTAALSSSTILAADATVTDLSPYYNNVGITDDSNPGAGNFDGYNDSYSAQALQAAGIVAGQAVSYGGVTFQWPKAAPGSPDDVLAQGQTVSLSAPTAGTTLAFLGATAHNSSAGTAIVTYSDGSAQSFQLSLSDWALNGGKIQPSPGDSIVATLPYRNSSNGKRYKPTYLFFTAVSLQPGNAVARVTLPAFNSFGPLHIFALSVAGSTAPPATATPSPTSTNTSLPTVTATASPTITSTPVAPAPGGLAIHVSGSQLVDAAGHPVVLRGVNRYGWNCAPGWYPDGGPHDASTIPPLLAWHINVVRIPLNEDCWLGINGVPAGNSGAAYQQAVAAYVALLTGAGIYAILDLHWSAPGTTLAASQQPMADQDHAPAFWSGVAAAFKGNPAVLFDLYNEPGVSPQCELAGCTATSQQGASYQTAGMQELVDAVRSAGASNVVLVEGVGGGFDLTWWVANEPVDPAHNLAASFHNYSVWCTTASCWDFQLNALGGKAPLIAGEVGESDGGSSYLSQVLPWFDGHGVSYLAWAWVPPSIDQVWGLIADFTSGVPSPYGQYYHDHLVSVAAAPPSPAGPPPTATATPAPGQVQVASVGATPGTVSPGGTIHFSTTVTSATALTNAIMNFDVVDANWVKVGQYYQAGVTLAANTPQQVSGSWTVPAGQAAGTYRVVFDVFDSTWSTILGRDQHTTFTIAG